MGEAPAGRSQGISVLAVDAIDDEPYISSQLCPAIQLGDQMAGGARLAQKALGAQESFVAIYKHLMDVETKIPRRSLDSPSTGSPGATLRNTGRTDSCRIKTPCCWGPAL